MTFDDKLVTLFFYIAPTTVDNQTSAAASLWTRRR